MLEFFHSIDTEPISFDFPQVLSRQELNMLPTFRHLLKMLSTFDAIFLLFSLSLFCVSAWSDHYNDYIR